MQLKVGFIAALVLACAGQAFGDNTKDRLFVEILDARNLKDEDWVGKSDPFVRVLVHDDKGAKFPNCTEVEWPIRDDTLNPSWFSTKMVCDEFPTDVEGSLMLHINIKEDDTFGSDDLGKFELNTTVSGPDVIHTFNVSTADGEKLKPPQTLRLRWSKSFPASATKRVYFVSEAETAKGKDRAMALQDSIQQRVSGSVAPSADEKAFLSSTLVLTSPLSQPIETALIALNPLAPHLTKPYVLKADARAKETSTGDLGDALISNVEDHMRKYLFDGNVPASMLYTAGNASTAEVVGQWWKKGETGDQFMARLNSFFTEQVMWYDDSNIIISGHSEFFQTVLATEMQPDLQAAIEACDPTKCTTYDRYTLKQWQSELMEHGSVMAVDLDFTGYIAKLLNASSTTPVATVKNVKFLFGTGLSGVVPPPMNTTAPTAAPTDAPTATPTATPTMGPTTEPTGSPTPTAAPKKSHSHSKTGAAIGAVIAVLVVLGLGGFGFMKWRARRRNFTATNAEALVTPYSLNKAF